MSIKSVQISLDKNILEICWSDDHISRFHAKWIRFHCKCVRCKPTVTFDYKIDIPSFSPDLAYDEVKITDEGQKLHVTFEKELFQNHVTEHDVDWLRQKCYCDACLEEKVKARDVISKHLRKGKKKILPKVDYKEIVDNSDRGTFKWLKHVIEEGMCLIENVPREEKMIEEIGSKVATLEMTSYGPVWSVIDTGVDNAAYSTIGLPLHQDQPTYESAPGLQLLHTLRFDSAVTGGDSTLVDMFKAVEILRKESPEDFQTLVEVPATYCQIDHSPSSIEPTHLEHQKPHITLDYFGKVVGCVWHPGLQSALQVRERDVERYYKAHNKMMEIIRREKLQYKFKLSAGDLIIFNNRRMLHARDAYKSNGGVRHLLGAYLRLDDVKSKYLVLARKLGYDVIPPKVGNNSSM
ncbi:gamma-butyrobetaine dioxygenase-like [Clavelina lepadiformis]|uniref:gamma-butyrobetaine dioxygenase-like n=1 Tax=Clavelina lepadiformis TaxID=159417 RepID=UPI0040429EA3